MLRATVSGSFHRHMLGIFEAVGSLRAAGINVLSPSDPRVVAHAGAFLFVASDRLRSIKLVQDRHLEAIRSSDFLWVVCPDGYTGASTSGEIMAAAVLGVPIFSTSPASDITIGQYVEQVSSIDEAMRRVAGQTRAAKRNHILLDPQHSIQEAIGSLERLEPVMLGRVGDAARDSEAALAETRAHLAGIFGYKERSVK